MVIDHVVGVGCGAAGDETAERAVDQRWEVSLEVLNCRQTLDTELRGTGDTLLGDGG